MSNLYTEIGVRLRAHRKSLGKTQQEVADILGMSLNFYGQIERGQSKVSLEKIILLYEKLDLDPTYLLIGKQSAVSFKDFISDCPKDKVFDMEQIIRYASNLYKKTSKGREDK